MGGGGGGGEQPTLYVIHAMRGFFRSISLGQNQPVANVLQVCVVVVVVVVVLLYCCRCCCRCKGVVVPFSAVGFSFPACKYPAIFTRLRRSCSN